MRRVLLVAMIVLGVIFLAAGTAQASDTITAVISPTGDGTVTSSTSCTQGPGAWQSLTVSGSALNLSDSLDLSITAVTTAKRMTVCVAGTVN